MIYLNTNLNSLLHTKRRNDFHISEKFDWSQWKALYLTGGTIYWHFCGSFGAESKQAEQANHSGYSSSFINAPLKFISLYWYIIHLPKIKLNMHQLINLWKWFLSQFELEVDVKVLPNMLRWYLFRSYMALHYPFVNFSMDKTVK